VRQHWVGCARACGTPGGRVAVIEALEPARPGGEERGAYRTVVRSGRVTG
jgi:precorrin-3B synthase